MTWVVGTRAPAPQAEAIPGRLWQSPKSRRLKPQPRRLVSWGRSLPCRRPPHAAAAYPAVLLLTKALAPSGQGRPRTVSDLSRAPEAQSPWTVGTPPAAGLSCDAQWRRDAAGVWGGFTPGRTTETGQTLLGDLSRQRVTGCAAHRGTWGQPDRSLPGQCRHTGTSDGSGLRATHAPGMEGGWQADPQPSRALPLGRRPSEPTGTPAAGPSAGHLCPERSLGWGPCPCPRLSQQVSWCRNGLLELAGRTLVLGEPGHAGHAVRSVSFPGSEDCPLPAPVPRGAPAPRGVRLHGRHAAVSAGLRRHLHRPPEVSPLPVLV